MTAYDPKRPLDNQQTMKKNHIQIGVGLIASISIFWLLDRFIPDAATGLTISLARMSLLAFIAFSIGGLIATNDFVVPAAVLATLAWLAVVGYSMYLGSSIGQPLWDYVVWNLPSSVLIPAVAIGAKIGTIAAAGLASSKTA